MGVDTSLIPSNLRAKRLSLPTVAEPDGCVGTFPGIQFCTIKLILIEPLIFGIRIIQTCNSLGL